MSFNIDKWDQTHNKDGPSCRIPWCKELTNSMRGSLLCEDHTDEWERDAGNGNIQIWDANDWYAKQMPGWIEGWEVIIFRKNPRD